MQRPELSQPTGVLSTERSIGSADMETTARMPDSPTREPNAEQCTLGRCLDLLGPVALDPVVLPRGRDLAIASVVIVGPGDPLPAAEGAIALLVGAAGASATAARIVQDAAALGYCAVVVKHVDDDERESVRVLGIECGLAILRTPDDSSWRQLSDLVGAVVAIGSVSDVDVGGPADLFALANSIASRVGGAVTIEDPRGRVLAYSSIPGQQIDQRRQDSILGRHTPERPENAKEYRRITQAAGRAVRFDFPHRDTEASRLAVAVLAGSEPVGLIFVLDHEPPLDDGAAARLEEAGRLTALHLIRSRAQQDPQRWARAEALRSLLDGIGGTQGLAERLGDVTRGATVTLAVTACRRGGPVAATRAPDVIAVQAHGWSPSSVTTTLGDVVYALLPVSGGTESIRGRLLRFGQDLVTTLARAPGLDMRVAIGPTAPSLEDVVLSRRVADRMLAAMALHPEFPRVVTLDDVRDSVTLLEIGQRERHMLDFYGGPAHKILAHDALHGTDYAETLLAYLDAFGKIDVAAQRLVVHENTLRYRIRRIAEIFGTSLEDPDERLVAWLQLRLRLRGAQLDQD